MTTGVALAVGLLAGAAVGALYFLWLWWALRRLVDRRDAGFRFAAHLVLRFAFALAGFALLARGGGLPMVAAGLAGFVAARTWLTRRLPMPPPSPGSPT